MPTVSWEDRIHRDGGGSSFSRGGWDVFWDNPYEVREDEVDDNATAKSFFAAVRTRSHQKIEEEEKTDSFLDKLFPSIESGEEFHHSPDGRDEDNVRGTGEHDPKHETRDGETQSKSSSKKQKRKGLFWPILREEHSAIEGQDSSSVSFWNKPYEKEAPPVQKQRKGILAIKDKILPGEDKRRQGYSEVDEPNQDPEPEPEPENYQPRSSASRRHGISSLLCYNSARESDDLIEESHDGWRQFIEETQNGRQDSPMDDSSHNSDSGSQGNDSKRHGVSSLICHKNNARDTDDEIYHSKVYQERSPEDPKEDNSSKRTSLPSILRRKNTKENVDHKDESYSITNFLYQPYDDYSTAYDEDSVEAASYIRPENNIIRFPGRGTRDRSKYNDFASLGSYDIVSPYGACNDMNYYEGPRFRRLLCRAAEEGYEDEIESMPLFWLEPFQYEDDSTIYERRSYGCRRK